MGSRGQYLKSGGFTECRYHTIARYNNVRYIVPNDNWNKHYTLAEKSNSPWAVYAEADAKGNLRTIAFYNGNRKKRKEIDLDKPHNGVSPHGHECDPKTSLRLKGKLPCPLTTKEQDKVKKIIAYYNKHNLAMYAKLQRKDDMAEQDKKQILDVNLGTLDEFYESCDSEPYFEHNGFHYEIQWAESGEGWDVYVMPVELYASDRNWCEKSNVIHFKDLCDLVFHLVLVNDGRTLIDYICDYQKIPHYAVPIPPKFINNPQRKH